MAGSTAQRGDRRGGISAELQEGVIFSGCQNMTTRPRNLKNCQQKCDSQDSFETRKLIYGKTNIVYK
jgi:hypothetical protein